ncbi:MAG: Gfo/Idh/MocA family oxidoreductase [Planctomycetes bacterium]|nr:Gfo/Idh/MocA family oxidoreductase [Planctomycetota bacterium]
MSNKISRREFVKAGSGTAALLASTPLVYAGGQEQTISVGLIGCGGRGTGAAENCLESSQNVKIVAMGDMFKDRIDGSRRNLSKRDGYKVSDDNVFVGFDAYKRVLDSGVDMVILATPPGFRPIHFAAAVDAGKHIFFEKPVGVDPTGIRKVIEAGKKAKEKKLAVVTGTQRRHQKNYLETIGKIHEGAIGDIVAARCYWNGDTPWVNKRRPEWNDMEYQLRNWYHYTWLCGDHIVEQHVHNLDVMNWVLKSHPLSAVAVGGKQVRTQPEYGCGWDHFGVDFTYPNDVHVLSMCRHWPKSPGNVSEAVVGTKGKSDCAGNITFYNGDPAWKPAGGGINPYVQEHKDLIASIRSGNLLNEAEQVAHSTLTAIMGREAAYTGQVIKWDEFLASNLDLTPPKYEFGPLPEPPIAVPGKKG